MLETTPIGAHKQTIKNFEQEFFHNNFEKIAQEYTLTKEQKEKMLNVFLKEIKKNKKSLSKEYIRYHVHYWEQHFKKTSNLGELRCDNPEQVSYKYKPSFTEVTFADKQIKISTPEALKEMVLNFPEVYNQFESLQESIKNNLERNSLVIISNHSTWLNVPIIISALQQSLNIPFKNFSTIVGPALTTYKKGFNAIRSFSNTIKTIPDTKNGNVPNLEEIIIKIKKETIKKLIETTNTPGNILIICPSGTTDKVDKFGNIIVQQPSKGSLSLLRFLNKNSTILPVGTNESDMFPNRQECHGEEYLQAGNLILPNTLSSPQKLMEELVELIVNEKGKKIGKLAN